MATSEVTITNPAGIYIPRPIEASPTHNIAKPQEGEEFDINTKSTIMSGLHERQNYLKSLHKSSELRKEGLKAAYAAQVNMAKLEEQMAALLADQDPEPEEMYVDPEYEDLSSLVDKNLREYSDKIDDIKNVDKGHLKTIQDAQLSMGGIQTKLDKVEKMLSGMSSARSQSTHQLRLSVDNNSNPSDKIKFAKNVLDDLEEEKLQMIEAFAKDLRRTEQAKKKILIKMKLEEERERLRQKQLETVNLMNKGFLALQEEIKKSQEARKWARIAYPSYPEAPKSCERKVYPSPRLPMGLQEYQNAFCNRQMMIRQGIEYPRKDSARYMSNRFDDLLEATDPSKFIQRVAGHKDCLPVILPPIKSRDNTPMKNRGGGDISARLETLTRNEGAITQRSASKKKERIDTQPSQPSMPRLEERSKSEAKIRTVGKVKPLKDAPKLLRKPQDDKEESSLTRWGARDDGDSSDDEGHHKGRNRSQKSEKSPRATKTSTKTEDSSALVIETKRPSGGHGDVSARDRTETTPILKSGEKINYLPHNKKYVKEKGSKVSEVEGLIKQDIPKTQKVELLLSNLQKIENKTKMSKQKLRNGGDRDAEKGQLDKYQVDSIKAKLALINQYQGLA